MSVTTTTLNKTGMQTDPRIYGKNIAYLNNGTDINLYDIEPGEESMIVPGTIKMEPAISDRGVFYNRYPVIHPRSRRIAWRVPPRTKPVKEWVIGEGFHG
jgi:hypothetical protein